MKQDKDLIFMKLTLFSSHDYDYSRARHGQTGVLSFSYGGLKIFSVQISNSHMILLDPIADNPNWIKQDKGAWDPNILDIIPARPGHMMTWWSHTRPRAPHNFLLPVLPEQSFPPPTMTFYEQTNNTEWGKVILVRLIFAPFMNSSMVIISADDGRPQPSDPASSKRVFGGEWPLSPHSFRIETKKWNGERNLPRKRRNIGRSSNRVGLSNDLGVSFQ